jgi:hypothetical protein
MSTHTLAKMRRFLEARATSAEAAEERCEFCSVPVGAGHSHIVDIERRALLCACRPCYLLFTNPAAAGGRYRAVPERYARLDRDAFHLADWQALDIPVGIAFIFQNSGLGRPLAFYPSPAGVTESSLPLETWRELVANNPILETLCPELEALLIRRVPAGFDCYIVPIDVCYELAGRIRTRWRGFDGGEEAWLEIEEFFFNVRKRALSGGRR